MNFLEDVCPLIWDVKNYYKIRRSRGVGRDEAISQCLEYFANELSDADDGPQVWIGLAEVTGKKRELTEELRQKALDAFLQIQHIWELEGLPLKVLETQKNKICSEELLGPEAKYAKKKEYKCPWQIGDTFAMELKSDRAKECGLENWFLLVRKDYEWYARGLDTWKNYFLLTVCPKDKLPKTEEEYNQLGYIPNQVMLEGLEYWVYLYVTGPRKTKYYEKLLTWIGNFKDAEPPFYSQDYKTPVPVGSCIFDSDFSEGLSYLEQLACDLYEKYGIIHGLDDLICLLQKKGAKENLIEKIIMRIKEEQNEDR